MNESIFKCPVCGTEFKDIHSFSNHMMDHSEKEKKRQEEEDRQRKEDQKKVDKANLDKLDKIYKDAYTNYINAKEKYEEKYGKISELDLNFKDLFDVLAHLDKNWDRF